MLATATRRAVTMPAAVPPLAVAGVAAMGCLFVGLVDPTRVAFLPTCPFKAVTGGLDCPGCGTTRAVHQLLNGNIGPAFGFNALALVAVPYVLYSWLAWALPTVSNVRLPAIRVPAKVVYGILVAVVAWWLLRNLPWAPVSALHSDR
jgi:hypothetical protein